jgi:hypothetical protein
MSGLDPVIITNRSDEKAHEMRLRELLLVGASAGNRRGERGVTVCAELCLER